MSLQVSVGFMPNINWKANELGYEVDIICRIDKSIVDIECTLSDWRPEFFADLHRRVLDVCRAEVDVVAFKMAWGLTVLLEEFEAPDGAIMPIVPTSPHLEKICTAYSLETGFDEACAHILRQPVLFMAMRELVTAITLPHVSLVECARAMDRIKNLLSPAGTKDKAAWQQLRDTLRIDEAYLKYITDASANPRHGQSGHTPGTVTTEVTRRAWVIMNRYLEYILHGEKPLDPAAYPFLDR
jgi:hypothetical protein